MKYHALVPDFPLPPPTRAWRKIYFYSKTNLINHILQFNHIYRQSILVQNTFKMYTKCSANSENSIVALFCMISYTFTIAQRTARWQRLESPVLIFKTIFDPIQKCYICYLLLLVVALLIGCRCWWLLREQRHNGDAILTACT